MAAPFMKPKGLGFTSPNCGSLLALLSEGQSASTAQHLASVGASSFLVAPCKGAEIIERRQQLAALLEALGRAELQPADVTTSFTDLKEFVDFESLKRLHDN